MPNSAQLLTDLQGLIRKLENDLRDRSVSSAVPDVGATLQDEYRVASQAKRTAASYQEWLEERITQMAIAWGLSAVFGRFLEDNGLVEPPKLSGVGKQLQRARDEHELYFRAYPTETDRDYLLAVFRDWAKLPVVGEIFGSENPIQGLPHWLSGDGGAEILKFFQRIDSETGALVHDFTDPSWDTRFLGDLYQDLSEGVRKKYALLQTPIFVEEFILDRTLEPALNEFGLHSFSLLPLGEGPGLRDSLGEESGERTAGEMFKLIDPACGSGHFLLGAFRRILRRWQSQEPNTNGRELVQRALDSVYGVDVNPYAVSIARFRLLLAALMECGITKLKDAPGFRINVACGDSLLHGSGSLLALTAHYSRLEDAQRLQQFLCPNSFHAVVANPPYITPKDKALNEAYRERYSTCYRQYSLAIPFMERIYDLAVDGGFTGQITANSFMKREFGKRLIEDFFKRVDLQTVIDTSGVDIPGHGTPTVILLGRKRKPVGSTIRTVMGIRGEPSTPENAAEGLVWSAIMNQLDVAGSESEFISVADVDRATFYKHPWSLGGGGASDLREYLDSCASKTLSSVVEEIGFVVITGEDNCLTVPVASTRRISNLTVIPFVHGEVIRDWLCKPDLEVLWCNDDNGQRLKEEEIQTHLLFLWPYRTSLKFRKAFGVPVEKKGIPWWSLREVYTDKIKISLSIAFAFVATHNHFVLDRGGKVFNRSAPVIKLAPDKTEDDHLALLGLLNSSTACFWMKQVFYPKATSTGDISVEKGKPEANRYEFSGTGLNMFPIPVNLQSGKAKTLTFISKTIDHLALELSRYHPNYIIGNLSQEQFAEIESILKSSEIKYNQIYKRMIALQEELDWEVYYLFGLSKEGASNLVLNNSDIGISAYDRPFSSLGNNLDHLLPQVKELYVQRYKQICINHSLKLIEDPVFKRPWWGRQGVYGRLSKDYEGWTKDSLQNWLLDRLETYFDFDGRMNPENSEQVPLIKGDLGGSQVSFSQENLEGSSKKVPFFKGDLGGSININLISTAKLADLAQQDPQFMAIAELYTGDSTFKIQPLINQLVENESVPLLPVLRYKPAGLRKRQEWENTWQKQRLEDQIDARTQLPKDHPQHLDLFQAQQEKQRQIGTIPVPPKYTNTDFLKTHYWRLRGKLDVPKERWISFPHCQKADGQPLIAWAGYNPLQLAQAISAYFIEIQEKEGGQDDPRLIPLLAGLIELLPWLKQWHNDIDPDFGLAMGDYFETFIQEEAKRLTLTLEAIQQWQPPKTNKRR